jgi:hypothetical protein
MISRFTQSMKSHFPNRLTAGCLAAIATLLLSSCAATALENEGAVNGVTKLEFKKLVVFAPFADPVNRKEAENQLKAKILRAEVIPSYTLLPDRKDLKDLNKVRTAVHATGADGIVLMRPTYYMTESEVTEGSTHNVTSTSGMSFGGYYGGYYGGYGGSYASVMMGTGDYETRQYSYQDPDTVKNTKVLQIETTIYQVEGEKMVWYGRVVSDNPSSPKQVITDAVNAIRATMVRDDLITAPSK